MTRREQTADNSSASHQGWRRAVPALFLVALVFALYGRTIGWGFLGLDDTVLLRDNQAFLQDPANIPRIFTQAVNQTTSFQARAAYYRPVVVLSFMTDSMLGGGSVWVFHLTNVLMHAAAGLILVWFLTTLAVPRPAAWTLGFVFAAHPLAAQAVVWIPARVDVMVMAFVLLSLICFHRQVDRGGFLWPAGHAVFFFLALLCKETAVFVPVYALAFLAFRSKSLKSPGRVIPLAVGWAAALALWILLRTMALPQSGGPALSELVDAFFNNLPLLPHYAAKAVLPFDLSPITTPPNVNYPLFVGAAGLVALSLYLSRPVDRFKAAAGILWFFVFLLPTLVVPHLTGGEYRAYLPLCGLMIVLSEIRLFRDIEFTRAHWKSPAASAAVVLTLAIACFAHTPAFKNRLNFWSAAIRDCPEYGLGYMNYGGALAEAGRLTEAVTVYEYGLRFSPKEPMLHNNLAVALVRLGRLAEAEKEFLLELKVNPSNTDAGFNLGLLYEQTERRGAAVRMWVRTLEIDPGHSRARAALAAIGRADN